MEIVLRSNTETTFNTILGAIKEDLVTRGNSLFAKLTQSVLADKLNLSKRTIRRHLSALEAEGYIAFTSKRGASGGAIIMLTNKGIKEVSGNPFLGDTTELDQLKAELFPDYVKKEPKRHYRDKKTIIEEKIKKQQEKENERIVNDRIEKEGVQGVQTFAELPDPEYAFRGYLAGQMYNAFCVSYYDEKAHRFFHKGMEAETKTYVSYRNRYEGTNCLRGRFVGTQNFTVFCQLADTCYKEGINPGELYQVQFDYVHHLGQNNKAKKGAVPYIPSLNSPIAWEAFHREVAHQNNYSNHEWNGYYNEIATITPNYPILETLSYVFTRKVKREIKAERGYITDGMPFNRVLDDIVTISESVSHMGMVEANAQDFLKYYENKVAELDTYEDLTTDEKDAMRLYMDMQVTYALRPGSFSTTKYAMAFPEQITSKIAMAHLHCKDKEALYTEVGNRHNRTDASVYESQQFLREGKELVYSYQGGISFFRTMRLASEYLGYTPNFTHLRSGLNKVAENWIPLDSLGFLDVKNISC